ncbi:MAG TPA: hypothetical protein VNL38_01605 [Candidatus Nitrosotenuis sp.]|nr:hypothetical protein [Candidatus Nitrosotenuis sp.]
MTSSFVLWLCFALGQAVHILKRAGMAVRSKKNPLRTRREFLRRHGDAIAVRAALCSALFWLLKQRPELLAQFLLALGAPPMELPLTGATALIFGYCADSLLDWLVSRVPSLQKDWPGVEDANETQ